MPYELNKKNRFKKGSHFMETFFQKNITRKITPAGERYCKLNQLSNEHRMLEKIDEVLQGLF